MPPKDDKLTDKNVKKASAPKLKDEQEKSVKSKKKELNKKEADKKEVDEKKNQKSQNDDYDDDEPHMSPENLSQILEDMGYDKTQIKQVIEATEGNLKLCIKLLKKMALDWKNIMWRIKSYDVLCALIKELSDEIIKKDKIKITFAEKKNVDQKESVAPQLNLILSNGDEKIVKLPESIVSVKIINGNGEVTYLPIQHNSNEHITKGLSHIIDQEWETRVNLIIQKFPDLEFAELFKRFRNFSNTTDMVPLVATIQDLEEMTNPLDKLSISLRIELEYCISKEYLVNLGDTRGSTLFDDCQRDLNLAVNTLADKNGSYMDDVTDKNKRVDQKEG